MNRIRGPINYPPAPVKPVTAKKPKRTKGQGIGKPWTDEEDALIRKCYYSSGAHALAAEMKRTPKAVQTRGSYLKVVVPKSLRVAA